MLNVKLAFRTLLRTPFVTLVAIASLGLGIGATAGIYSLFNQLLVRPLPVPAAHELVNLTAPGPKPGSQSCNNAGDCDVVFSYPMYRDLERQQDVLWGLAAHRAFGANLAARGQTESSEGMLVSGNYFQILGLTPAAGRLFSPQDDRTVGGEPIAVLSHAYWRRRFDQSLDVLNSPITVNGQVLTVVGVAPAGFTGTTLGTSPDIFVPITLRARLEPGFNGFDNRRSYWAYLFGRLKPGVTMDQARAALNVPYRAILTEVEAPLQRGMSDQTMARFKTKDIGLEPGQRGQSSVPAETKTPLMLLLGVTVLVLLIACANIANLLLARSVARGGEMAIRLSIGASRRHLFVQLLTESLVLAACGGLAGVAIAYGTLRFMAWLLPPDAAGMVNFSLDTAALTSTAIITVATGVAFGLVPALHATRANLASALKGQSGQPSGARAAARFRTTLATVQMAFAMTLLVAAGLFTRSLFNVARVDLGLDADRLVTFAVSPELNGYTAEQSMQLFERLEDELAAQPGVVGVSASMIPLLAGNNWGSDVSVEGFTSGPDIDANARFNELGPAYFRTLGVPMLAGREFTRADVLDAPKVAIVNQQFAKKFNLGANPVGKRMAVGGRELDIEIVGLVRDVKYSEVKDPVPAMFFIPFRQDRGIGGLAFYVRAAGDPDPVLAAVPRLVAQLDPNLPVEDLRTMHEQVRQNVFLDRFVTMLSIAFASLATLLAAIGLYGVLAYTVAQRTRELGLRMALGAAPAHVRGLIIRQVGRMTLVGGLVGLAAAAWTGRAAEAVLYELRGWDPVVLVTAGTLLTAVALGAGFIPALRASRVDPMTALRYE
ncbi:MAG: ABC transporter permease [Vicinamibacteraceae bacterium]|nr:ABC transporter permease [Vicinamibacteraceae bacterium]